MKKIIFGGAFDPIHNGHIRVAREASKKFNATVIFVPAKNPRWKEPTETSENRLEMLKLALKAVDFKYEIEEYELNSNAEVNYSIDTIKHLKEKYANDNLYLLIFFSFNNSLKSI